MIVLNISAEMPEEVDISAILYLYENNGYIHFCEYINMKIIILLAIVAVGLVPYASAAQLDAVILSGEDSTRPSFQFLRVVYIEYPDGGEIADILQGKTMTVSFDANGSTEGMNKLIENINESIRSAPSNAVASDAKLRYQAILQGNEKSAVIEYKVQITPTITNHVLATSFEKSTVDANWRGISISEPIIIQTKYGLFDVNNPRSALDIMVPNISKELSTVKILDIPLVDASGILTLPLDKWHSLFDNTAIISGAKEFKYSGKNVITHYSMGECSIEIGLCNDRKWTEDITLDKKYTVRIIESRDDASIAIEGYVDSDHVNGIEVFKTSLKSLVTQKPDTDEFPAAVIYGMAGIAAVGGGVMFVISDRKVKKDKDEGQTGIDPSHLISYETSDSAKGYKTNRGESYLVQNRSRMPI